MRKGVLILILIYTSVKLFSQDNLIPNNSFEDYYYCPTKCNGMTLVKGWELSDFSSDYINYNCNNGNGGTDCPVNNSIINYKTYDGIACAGLGYPSELIECKLLKPLVKDSLYQITLYVILGNKCKNTTNNLGVYFSKDKITRISQSNPFKEVFSLKPQLQNSEENYFSNLSWQRLSWEYTANGNEQYFLISGFKNMWTQKELDKSKTEPPYLYIDNVSLIPKAKSKNLDHKISENVMVLRNVQFDQGESNLTNRSKQELDSVAIILKKQNVDKLKISGHTDNSSYDNLKLSEDRAKSVRDYLLTKGFLKQNISCNGYGALFPIMTNETDFGRAKNRRVEIEIIK